MNKRPILDFLCDLRRNNSKDWMDAHRERYHTAKDIWLREVQVYLDRLATHDATIGLLEPRQTIMRINNNNVFHPEKPTYKHHFGFDPYKGKDNPAFYVHVEPGNCFIAGGVWHPTPGALKDLRGAFDYDGEKLKAIVADADFAAYFGGLDEDEQALKTSPRDYPDDHRHIDLLRRKNFTVTHEVTQVEVLADDFVAEVERAFLLLRPFNAYLRRAIGG